MPMFFVDNIKNNLLEITGDDFYHIVKSLRKKIGEPLLCFNSDYIFYTQITTIDKNFLTAKIIKKEKIKKEKFSINLFTGLIKYNRFELLLEKVVELGVTNITPIITDYTQLKIDPVKNKLKRWEKIIYEAVKQSHNLNMPKINNAVSFYDAIKNLNGANILFHPYAENIFNPLKNITEKNINIFIGPEGGFSKDEIKIAEENKFHILKLPFNTILKTETACMTGITLVRNWLYGV